MKLKIAVGRENFINLRKSNSYYVDKTEVLYDLFEKNDAVTVFTRPRRFGKTLTMSMIGSFFSIEKKEDRSVFDGLAIMKHQEFCDTYMNRYPVMFISLGTGSYDKNKAVMLQIGIEFKRFVVLLSGISLNEVLLLNLKCLFLICTILYAGTKNEVK